MSIPKNTTNVNLDPVRKTRFSVQNGSNMGATAPNDNFPLNQADVSLFNPNDYLGPTFSPYFPIDQMYDNGNGSYTMILNGDWEGKLKTGDPFNIRLGSITRDFFIQKLTYHPDTSKTHFTFSNLRSELLSIDSFVGPQGFPYVSSNAYVSLSRTLENPNSSKDLINSFDVKIAPSDKYEDCFSMIATWTMSPYTSATRIRWRAVPSISPSSTLSFTVNSSGDYADFPELSLSSDTGRSAIIVPTCSVGGISLGTGGTGYTYAYSEIVGDGTGASVTFTISGGSLTGVGLANGGTGYSNFPLFNIIGDGTGASAYIDSWAITGVKIIQQGGGYLSPPAVNVSDTYLIGSSASISSSLYLDTSGKINFVRILEGGTGYTGANITFAGGTTGNNATAYAQILNGSIDNVVLTSTGDGYSSSPIVVVTPTGTGGTGASIKANVDYLSEWYYEAPLTYQTTKTISGLKANVVYEIQILASTDPNFRAI